MDVHVMRHGPEAMRRIQIPVALHVRESSPQPFSLARCKNAAQIVEISRFSMSNLAEESIAQHLQNHHLGGPLAAVLKNDAVPASGFGGIHQVPALLQCRRRWHLDGRMLA